MRLVEEQVCLGPRVPGTAPHDALARTLEERLRDHGAEVSVQEFPVELRGALLNCRNIVGVFRATGSSGEAAGVQAGAPAGVPATGPAPTVLLGSHYDTRIRGDRDPDPARRELPIPGANDGGSGTAVLLHMLPRLSRRTLKYDVAIAFLDAEDLGNIDGKEFALGAEWLAGHPLEGWAIQEALILDMVGGKDMVFDIDAHILHHPSSRTLTTEVFGIGMSRGWQPFTGDKKDRLKYIVSDHTPFARRGIPSCILIDIDYPQWHTQADLPDAMSAEALGVTEGALWLFLTGRQARALRSSPGT
jgi:glutaminyl-peptide cyclotransferase